MLPRARICCPRAWVQSHRHSIPLISPSFVWPEAARWIWHRGSVLRVQEGSRPPLLTTQEVRRAPARPHICLFDLSHPAPRYPGSDRDGAQLMPPS